MTPNHATPSLEEKAYIEAYMEQYAGQGEVSREGGFFAKAAGVVCKPLEWWLYYMAGGAERRAWRGEEEKGQGAIPGGVVVDGRSSSKWKLDCWKGRQIWYYGGEQQDVREARHTGNAELEDDAAGGLDDAMEKSLEYLKVMQSGDGHWANGYGGPLFLLPGLVIAKYVIHEGDVKSMFPPEHIVEMIRFMFNVQNPDSGWGLHEQGRSTLFGTTLNYVALRMLGVDTSRLTTSQNLIASLGGATSIPTWGKAWLAIANLYSWEGINPVTPETWLLPKWCPLYPGNLWCHTRLVYLPLGYLYGRKFQTPLNPFLQSLRGELYSKTPYEHVDWVSAAQEVAAGDVHYPTHWVAKIAFKILRWYEKVKVEGLRAKALAVCVERIKYDDVTTGFICLGPVNKALNLVAVYAAEGRSTHLKLSENRVSDYLWVGQNGMLMNGYNGSQLWDTSFALQAMKAAKIDDTNPTVKRGLQYIDDAQVMVTPHGWGEMDRDDPYGAWNFSTSEQNWQVSDCTAEGLRCALLYNSLPQDRIRAGVDQLLSLRNPSDCAFSSYEPRRAPTYLELLNPADIFTRIMVEYTYTECTAASLLTLRLFQDKDAAYRSREIQDTLAAGTRFLLKEQNPDGSWYGSWGVCFTYGTYFGIEGLLAGGVVKDAMPVQRAVEFLLSKQRRDGGWSEDVRSCAVRRYIESPCGSQPTQTALALMGLLAAVTPSSPPECATAIHAAATYLIRTQRGGRWTQAPITGVFNGTCGIHYPFYPVVFPYWALAQYNSFLNRE